VAAMMMIQMARKTSMEVMQAAKDESLEPPPDPGPWDANWYSPLFTMAANRLVLRVFLFGGQQFGAISVVYTRTLVYRNFPLC